MKNFISFSLAIILTLSLTSCTERIITATDDLENNYSTSKVTKEFDEVYENNIYEPDAEITTAYITPYGEKYHFSASCAGKNAIPEKLEDVIDNYAPCKKCAH